MVNSINIKEMERMSKEITTMKKELDDMKEVVRGLVQFIMKREELDDEEYN
ncbi:MAG: hypothetical protein M1414_02365 [Candidatus Thermoplasmatota archaeon]|jgi:hypothetical protein|nr:hypothetical protein [Candidatus Thermoplasmatota archaeon]MCL5987731.1 hypothetical protein [Candidatus Thermoplasmatota archaeon]